MIVKNDIMKRIEHMETNTPKQIEEKNVAFIEKHEAYMIKLKQKARLSREKHETYMMQVHLQIQGIRTRTPKRQIYVGKVKTE